MRKILIWCAVSVALIFIGLHLVCRSENHKVLVSVKPVLIKTYEYFDPDPVPILTRKNMWGGGRRLYPYNFFNRYTGYPSSLTRGSFATYPNDMLYYFRLAPFSSR